MGSLAQVLGPEGPCIPFACAVSRLELKQLVEAGWIKRKEQRARADDANDQGTMNRRW